VTEKAARCLCWRGLSKRELTCSCGKQLALVIRERRAFAHRFTHAANNPSDSYVSLRCQESLTPKVLRCHAASQPNSWNEGDEEFLRKSQQMLRDYGAILVEEGLLSP